MTVRHLNTLVSENGLGREEGRLRTGPSFTPSLELPPQSSRPSEDGRNRGKSSHWRDLHSGFKFSMRVALPVKRSRWFDR